MKCIIKVPPSQALSLAKPHPFPFLLLKLDLESLNELRSLILNLKLHYDV